MVVQKDFPAEAKGLNWGALLLSWIWGLGNAVGYGPVALMFFIPLVGPIVGLLKGNEWAWRGKDWANVESFKATQKKWAMAGILILLVALMLACCGGCYFWAASSPFICLNFGIPCRDTGILFR